MDNDPRYVYFLDNEAFEETDRVGFRRRVINGENLQLCFWRIADQATCLLYTSPSPRDRG